MERRRLESAFVYMFVDYPDAWLELRSTVDDGSWRRVCPMPCEQMVHVAGRDARVTARDMTPSNPFRISPGKGTARFKVSGGSAAWRSNGILTLAIGIPVTLTGMGLWSYGKVDESDGLQTAGLITLGVGAVAILGSLPMLAAGSTRVRNAEGSIIASGPQPPRF